MLIISPSPALCLASAITGSLPSHRALPSYIILYHVVPCCAISGERPVHFLLTRKDTTNFSEQMNWIREEKESLGLHNLRDYSEGKKRKRKLAPFHFREDQTETECHKVNKYTILGFQRVVDEDKDKEKDDGCRGWM